MIQIIVDKTLVSAANVDIARYNPQNRSKYPLKKKKVV